MQLLGPRANNDSPESDLSLFQQFLADPSTTIPIDSNFIIFIESFPNGLKTFSDDRISEFEPNKWSVSQMGSKLTSTLEGPSYNYKCFFANGVTLPNESIGSKRVGLSEEFGEYAGGVLSGVVSNARSSKQPLRATFLETTDSFIDSVLRPWVVAVSHYGLFAREADSNYNVKTNIKVCLYNNRASKSSIERKVYTFFDCAPISFDEQTVTWGSSDTKIVATQWVYNYYTIKTSSGSNADTASNRQVSLTNAASVIRSNASSLLSFTANIRPPGV